jgi:hypothetical protein
MIEQYLTNPEFETYYPKLNGLRGRIVRDFDASGIGIPEAREKGQDWTLSADSHTSNQVSVPWQGLSLLIPPRLDESSNYEFPRPCSITRRSLRESSDYEIAPRLVVETLLRGRMDLRFFALRYEPYGSYQRTQKDNGGRDRARPCPRTATRAVPANFSWLD